MLPVLWLGVHCYWGSCLLLFGWKCVKQPKNPPVINSRKGATSSPSSSNMHCEQLLLLCHPSCQSQSCFQESAGCCVETGIRDQKWRQLLVPFCCPSTLSSTWGSCPDFPSIVTALEAIVHLLLPISQL